MNFFNDPKLKRILSALKKRGFEDDEIESMCSSEEELRKLYDNIIKAEETPVNEKDFEETDDDEDEPESEDSFKLPKDEESRLLTEAKEQLKAEKAHEYEEKDAVKDPETGKALVSYEEMLESLKGLESEDGPHIPNN